MQEDGIGEQVPVEPGALQILGGEFLRPLHAVGGCLLDGELAPLGEHLLGAGIGRHFST
ncbi:hypothetical protein D3C78_1844490 [compost metagenome]